MKRSALLAAAVGLASCGPTTGTGADTSVGLDLDVRISAGDAYGIPDVPGPSDVIFTDSSDGSMGNRSDGGDVSTFDTSDGNPVGGDR